MIRYFLRLLAKAVGLVAVLAVPVAVSAATYYLSLGDSLAFGLQPTDSNDQGYADQLFRNYPQLKAQYSVDSLMKLGCPGETTDTMINGGICTYNDSNGLRVSQLKAAVDFLQKNKVALVTIDIGANELLGCQIGMSLDPNCIINTLAVIKTNLPDILRELHKVAPDVPIVGMNYYDPALASWLEGKDGRVAAWESLLVILPFNYELKRIYMAAGSPVADVEGAFLTTNMVTRVETPLGILPTNVAKICAWTWMCTMSNIHPNDTGYGVIAKAFADVLGLTSEPHRVSRRLQPMRGWSYEDIDELFPGSTRACGSHGA
jgi:lysophospholipase L1-like esterase